jgi:serine/threonine protein kinase
LPDADEKLKPQSLIEGAPDVPESAGDGGPKEIGNYKIIRKLGHGGMGTVYEVEHSLLHQRFALKVLSPDRIPDRSVIERFRAEAKAISALEHPNLLRIFEFGISASGQPFMVTDLCSGQSLSEFVKAEYSKGRKVPTEAILEIMTQAANALSHAHQRGIIHRDLKPSNILLGGTAYSPDVKIIDFGIAKQESENGERPTLTATGEIIGTPQYMSPEQGQGYKLDARSDVYSLGCVLYEMLAGIPPFNSGNPLHVLVQHLNEQPTELRLTDPVRRRLEQVALKCLAKDRDHRYQSMDELTKDLNAIASGADVKIKRPKPASRTSFRSRLKVYVPVAIVAMLVALGAALYELWAPSVVLYTDLPLTNMIMSRDQARAIVAIRESNRLRIEAKNADGTPDMDRLNLAEQMLKPASVGNNPWNRQALIRLGEIMAIQGKTEAVEKLCRSIAVDEFGYATALHNVAVSIDQAGYHAQARPYMEQAYKTFERVAGPNHPATLKDRFNLVTVDYNLGNEKKALQDAQALLPTLEQQKSFFAPLCRQIIEELEARQKSPSSQ